MKKQYFVRLSLIALAAILMVACSPSREERIAQIEDFEDSISEMPLSVDTNTANELTDLYVTFADKYETDSLAPIYLLKAGEVQANIPHTERAVAIFDRVISNYPDFEELPICYFLKGYALEFNEQFDEAKAAYQEFVDKYPNHYLAEGTRVMIPRIGMSPEEMLESVLAEANDTIIAQE